jgi:hypothetical protein
MGIASFLIELIAIVIFEPASLASSLRRRWLASDFPANKCAECKGPGTKIKENENWLYFQCDKCQKKWVIPRSEKTYERVRRQRKKAFRKRST